MGIPLKNVTMFDTKKKKKWGLFIYLFIHSSIYLPFSTTRVKFPFCKRN